MCKRRAALTLVELLVVIAMIGILVALLLPHELTRRGISPHQARRKV